METKKKKGFFPRHAKSSAIVVSIAVHAVILGAAVFLVALQVIKEDPVVFIPGNAKKKPKPPQIPQLQPLKETAISQPSLSQVTPPPPKIAAMNDTAIPAVSVVNISPQYGSMLSDLSIPEFSPFGGNRESGNELVGTFYDLKQTKDGEATGVDEEACIEIINGFIGSGWNERRFENYFKAPRPKYTTCFMMPQMGADEAPKAFEVENQVKPSYWLCLYKGRIAAPETGRYRLLGLGDDVLSVRIGKKLVLDACWHNKIGRLSNWKSDDDDDRKYPLEGEEQSYIVQNSTLVIGDWFNLRKGHPVDMEVLIGELPGSAFSCRLLVQQQGKEYKTVPYAGGMRPVLPVFMTAPIEENLVPMMKIRPDVATVEGPVFGVLTNAK